MNLVAHQANIQIERDLAEERLNIAKVTPGVTFEELRVLQRNMEHLEHQLMYIRIAPKGWVR